MRVPGGVEDLLVEVQAVHVDLILLALPAGAHLKKKGEKMNVTCEYLKTVRLDFNQCLGLQNNTHLSRFE